MHAPPCVNSIASAGEATDVHAQGRLLEVLSVTHILDVPFKSIL